jgi:hypothetical protein
MDPSQLFGILRYVIRHPLKVLFGKVPDRLLLRLWWGDVKYYLGCGLFDGRKAPRKWNKRPAPGKNRPGSDYRAATPGESIGRTRQERKAECS